MGGYVPAVIMGVIRVFKVRIYFNHLFLLLTPILIAIETHYYVCSLNLRPLVEIFDSETLPP